MASRKIFRDNQVNGRLANTVVLIQVLFVGCHPASTPDRPATAQVTPEGESDSDSIKAAQDANPSVMLTAGTIFYLSPDGNDENPGTKSAPIRTLNKAWTVLSAGDLVYLRGGEYQFDRMQYLAGKQGTPDRPIRIWGFPGEQPRLTRSPQYQVQVGVNQELIYFEGDHFHWRGIEICHFDQKPGDYAWSAFRIGATNHSTFERIDYHHNGAGMSVRGDSTGNLFLNCDFHHNQDPYSTDAYDGADGIDLHYIRTGTQNTLRGCRAWWNSDDGIDCWDNNGFVLIENCWSFYNGYKPGTFEEAGNGSGFKLGATSSPPDSHLRTVRNCIAFRNRTFGIVENGANCQSEVFHNACAENGLYGYWFGSWGTNVATLRNNLGWNNQEERFSSHDIVENNSWQNDLVVSAEDFLSTDDSQLLRNRHREGGLPAILFLRLAKQSDLVNAGKDVGLPYAGTAPDVGPFEFDSAPKN